MERVPTLLCKNRSILLEANVSRTTNFNIVLTLMKLDDELNYPEISIKMVKK